MNMKLSSVGHSNVEVKEPTTRKFVLWMTSQQVTPHKCDFEAKMEWGDVG